MYQAWVGLTTFDLHLGAARVVEMGGCEEGWVGKGYRDESSDRMEESIGACELGLSTWAGLTLLAGKSELGETRGGGEDEFNTKETGWEEGVLVTAEKLTDDRWGEAIQDWKGGEVVKVIGTETHGCTFVEGGGPIIDFLAKGNWVSSNEHVMQYIICQSMYQDIDNHGVMDCTLRTHKVDS